MEVRLREASPDMEPTVSTDEAVPSAIGKGEIRPRASVELNVPHGLWGVLGSTHSIRFEAKLTSKFVRCMSLLLFLEAAEASSGLICVPSAEDLKLRVVPSLS